MESGEKIFFHSRKIFSGDRIAGDQNQIHRLNKLMLMEPETFTQQAPSAAATRGIADFFGGNDAQSGRAAFRQPVPISDETTEHEALAPLPDTREIATLRESRGAAQAQAFRRSVHKLKRASGVCDPRGGGWPRWPCRSWWSCG